MIMLIVMYVVAAANVVAVVVGAPYVVAVTAVPIVMFVASWC